MHRTLKRPLVATAIFLGLGFLPVSAKVASSAAQTDKASQAPVIQAHLAHPDTVCRNCHEKIYDLYEQTPMARGSGLAIEGLDSAELAAKDFTHRGSGVTYNVSARDTQPYLHYSRPATSARPALDGRFRLDFFIGSGRRGRTYLYNVDGLWFETPINWYSKTKMWDMAPAYDNARAMPDPLPIDPNCLHCHAGDVQPEVGPARNRYAAQPFQSAGIGCAACHGDPTQHLRQTSRTPHTIDASQDQVASGRQLFGDSGGIVNPAKLDHVRRDGICLQCHLEGDAAVYLPGKSLQMFKPGEDLSKSVTYFIDSTRAQLGLRASSQYEALLRSACKRAAGDRLTCTTCHDPHSSPAPADRVAYFRSRCLACHNNLIIATNHHSEQQDCSVCHMPTRRTSDISHEQLTDHDVEASPDTLQAPLPTAKRKPANLIPVGNSPTSVRELGLAYAQLADRGDQASGQKALSLLGQAELTGKKDFEVLDQLAFLLQVSGSTIPAAEHYLAALKQNPFDITAQSNLAVIDASAGQTEVAIDLLSQAVKSDPSRTAAGLNLAFLQCRTGRKTQALQTIELLLRYNPDSIQLHHFADTGSYGDQRCILR